MESENRSELGTNKTSPGLEDEYMEDEVESDESVRAGVRVLDEDSDGEEDRGYRWKDAPNGHRCTQGHDSPILTLP
jgi:hypothetical protein